MNYEQMNRSIIKIFGVAVLLTLSHISYAEHVPFRIAFEDVPGSEQLVAGDVQEGIRILEAELEKDDSDRGYILSTLCGAYLMDKALNKARPVCDQAANKYPGESSFNNRGVYRAVTGNLAGAIDDFKRAQPLEPDQYLEFLRTKDIGLIAMQNTDLLSDYQSRHTGDALRTVPVMAEVEDITQ